MEWVGVMHLIVMVKPATSDCLATWGQQKRVVSTTLTYHHLLRLYVELAAREQQDVESCLCRRMNVGSWCFWILLLLFLISLSSCVSVCLLRSFGWSPVLP